jgi:hypothetical protein
MCRVSVMGPVSDELRDALGSSEAEDFTWKWIPAGIYLTFQPERGASSLDGLKDAFAVPRHADWTAR